MVQSSGLGISQSPGRQSQQTVSVLLHGDRWRRLDLVPGKDCEVLSQACLLFAQWEVMDDSLGLALSKGTGESELIGK